MTFSVEELFKLLYQEYSAQGWWPAKTAFEVCVGAILAQATSWKNVEKAIANLGTNRVLNLSKIAEINEKQLAELIKSSGYHNQKAERLKLFCRHVTNNYNGSLEKMFEQSIYDLRDELLSLKGIGEETADSIILYAARKPIFVVDAYTKRVINRIYGTEYGEYSELQEFFHNELPKSVQVYNEFHALLVEHGKLMCKTKPVCEKCFLKKECNYNYLHEEKR